MNTIPKNAALILIDLQQEFDDLDYWGPRNNPGAEANASRLLRSWRESARPVFHVQHLSTTATSPLRPGQPGCQIKSEVQPLSDEPVIGNVNSAFIGTDLRGAITRHEHRYGGHRRPNNGALCLHHYANGGEPRFQSLVGGRRLRDKRSNGARWQNLRCRDGSRAGAREPARRVAEVADASAILEAMR